MTSPNRLSKLTEVVGFVTLDASAYLFLSSSETKLNASFFGFSYFWAALPNPAIFELKASANGSLLLCYVLLENRLLRSAKGFAWVYKVIFGPLKAGPIWRG
jgi:hypothetical protein